MKTSRKNPRRETTAASEDGVTFADHVLLTPRQAARWLHTTPGNLAVLRCERRGPSFTRVGRKVFYFKSDILAYLNSQRRQLDPPPAA